MTSTSGTIRWGSPATPGLLETKLHPPPVRAQSVLRERLLERLRPDAALRLVLVAAPAGCGKTTLLGMWRERESAHRPVAWVTLDEGDNDPVVLWSHVLAALQRSCPALDVAVTPERVGAARIVDVFLPHVVNGLAEQGDAALVLDDFHRLTNGSARDSVAWFVEHAPSSFQLVLSSRNEPALPLAALRAHGELLEVRADDLAFTTEDADALMNGRFEFGLAADEIDDLVDRTEGWPAGLYLAALSLQGVPDRHAFVRKFGGGNRYVVDFLVDEVLDAHDVSTQELMLRTSVLERLCGRLCDAVLEQEGTGEMLARLSRTNLFLLPLDDHGEWYRFHQLFAHLLRVELEHREPGLAATLHRRASAWHRQDGSVDAAIEHALAAEAFDEAGELIAGAWVDYVNVSRHATVLGWLERFPEALLREDPGLLLVAAWVHALCGQRAEEESAIAAFERLAPVDDGPLPDGFSSLQSSLLTLRGLVNWGDTGAGLKNARRAAELEGFESPWRPVVCGALALGLYFGGEFEEAYMWAAEAAELAQSRERVWISAGALAYCSYAAGNLGFADRQAALAERAVRLARERGTEEVDGEAFVALGSSLAARGRLEEALPLLEQGVECLRSFGYPRPLADALIRYATALQSAGRREAADAALDEASAIIGSCRDPGALGEWLAAARRPSRVRRSNDTAPLSERELVVLRMLNGPLSERDIGRELYLSHNTVHSHARSIYRKLGVSSRAAAVVQARLQGLL